MEKSNIICPKCGTSNLGDARFCENCGSELFQPGMQNQAPANGNGLESGYAPNHSVPNYSMQGNGYGMPQQPVQAAEKQPVPKWIWMLAGEAVVLLLCIFGITKAYQKSISPEQIAEEYFVYMANGDWKEGYERLDAKDTEFINVEMFEKMHPQVAPGIVTNYQMNGQPAEQALNEWSQELYNLAGEMGLQEYLNQGQQSSSLEKFIQVDFRVEGDTENTKYLIPLNQTREGWKVMASNYICKGYRLCVPKGSAVSMDGIALEEKYLVTDEETEDYLEEDYLDVYEIPQIFYGSHEIKIALEDMEDVEEMIEISAGDYQYRRETMQIKEEILDTLIQKAGENMQQIYSAAIAGKNFQAIENLFISNEESRKEIKDSYEYLLADLNEGNYLPTKIAFQNIEGRAESSGSQVNLDFEYALDYRYQSWGEWEEDTYRDKSNWTFYFTKEDGNWVQTNLGCQTLYY